VPDIVHPPDERKLLDELHSYCRHTIQLWVQWFTFFLTVNYLALGWFAGKISEQQILNRRPLDYVAALFVAQNALGIGTCCVAAFWFVKNGRALKLGYGKLGLKPPEFAHKLYATTVIVGALAMVLVAGCWLVFALRA